MLLFKFDIVIDFEHRFNGLNLIFEIEIEIVFSSSRYIPMKNRDTRSDGRVIRNNNKITFNCFPAIPFKTTNSIVDTYH